MSGTFAVEKRRVAGMTVAALRKEYCRYLRMSGMEKAAFEYEVETVVNMSKGYCPDGCCGGPDGNGGPSRPSPAEFVAGARVVAESSKSSKKGTVAA